jgi:hypothetical protein
MFTDDQDIDRELKGALNVEPSAGFEGRVGRRIHEDRSSRRWVAQAWLAGAAALVVMAGVWLLVSRGQPPVHAPTMVTERTPNAGPIPRDPGVAPSTATRNPSPTATARRVRRVPPQTATQVTGRPAPEVIVPGDQLHLIQQLVREVNAGRLFVPEVAPARPNVPAELVITPVVIDPIPVVTIEPGGGSGSGPKGLQ